MMFVDAHCHIFTPRIVDNVEARPAMLAQLRLNTHEARSRLDPADLHSFAGRHGLAACVLLPSASPSRVVEENDRFIGFTKKYNTLRTLATLHPDMPHLEDEIRRIFDRGIRGFKFSSFSQRFDPSDPAGMHMLAEVEAQGHKRGFQPIVVMDTFVRADTYFGADPRHLTTPARLDQCARNVPGINFVAAHMGGLLADLDEIRRNLPPAPNLYLDTANAAHTLAPGEFVELLTLHGPFHILFGTDWPWFDPMSEREVVGALLEQAGYNAAEQAAVFGGNAFRLFCL